MTAYLGLLRGVNVGGNAKVEMARLRALLGGIGFSDVRTYINSGNVLFRSEHDDRFELARRIEVAIGEEFGFPVAALVWDFDQLERLEKALPAEWVDDPETRCDVIFLWPEIDREGIVAELPTNPEVEELRYFQGVVVRRVDRSQLSRSRLTKVVGIDLYRKMSMRSRRTVDKLYELMRDA